MDYPIQSPTQLSHQIRALRKARGLSQAQLGALLGLSQSRIARIENSPTQISVDSLLQLLAVLQVRMVLEDQSTNQTETSAQTTANRFANITAKGDW